MIMTAATKPTSQVFARNSLLDKAAQLIHDVLPVTATYVVHFKVSVPTILFSLLVPKIMLGEICPQRKP